MIDDQNIAALVQDADKRRAALSDALGRWLAQQGIKEPTERSIEKNIFDLVARAPLRAQLATLSRRRRNASRERRPNQPTQADLGFAAQLARHDTIQRRKVSDQGAVAVAKQASWQTISMKERRVAKQYADAFHDWPAEERGRPGSPLQHFVAKLITLLEKPAGRRLGFSRPATGSGPPSGPTLRLVVAALAFAFPNEPRSHETVARPIRRAHPQKHS